MLVFGDIGEVRKVAEGADDRDRTIDRKLAEQGLQATTGGLVGFAMKPDRDLPDALDLIEDFVALLGAYGFPESPAEQAHIVAGAYLSPAPRFYPSARQLADLGSLRIRGVHQMTDDQTLWC